MTVYCVTQIKYKDKETYDRYAANFFEVFRQFNGRLLINDENPRVLEGEWQNDKLVMMSFPDKASFKAWVTSPAYQAIMVDRVAGADATILLSEELDIHA